MRPTNWLHILVQNEMAVYVDWGYLDHFWFRSNALSFDWSRRLFKQDSQFFFLLPKVNSVHVAANVLVRYPAFMFRQYSIRTLLLLMAFFAAASLVYICCKPQPRVFETTKKRSLEQHDELPSGSVYWFIDGGERIVSALLIFMFDRIDN